MKIKDIILEAAYHDAKWVNESERLERLHRLAVKQGDTERAEELEKEIEAHYKKGATNEAKEIDDWDDQDDYEEEDNPYKASGLPNIITQIETAQDMFKEFADDPKFKKPTLKFVDGEITVVSDAEYNENKDKKTLPEKYLKLFMDEYFKLKDKKQMQNDAIMSRKGFIGAIKNAMDGKYGGAAEKSPYSRGGGMTRSKNTTTQYSY